MQNTGGKLFPVAQKRKNLLRQFANVIGLSNKNGSFSLPGKHAEESLEDLACEGDSHLYPQSLKQCQEESQHLIRHVYKGKGIEIKVSIRIVVPEIIQC